MVCWGRWRTLPNGQRICIEDKSSKPVVIVAVIIILGALGGGTVVAAGGAVAAGSAAQSVASQSIQTRVTNSRSAARRGQSIEAWRRMGLRVITRTASREIRPELQCTTHAYGEVRAFLNRTPCRSMQRTQTVLCDEHGNNITMSTVWVQMPSPVSAQRLKLLVDSDGSGNVLPSAGSGGVRFIGKHYASRRTGSLIVIAETASAGRPATAMLDGVAEVAAEFPQP